MARGVQDFCAFSDSVQKLYSVSDPLDGVKAMLPSLSLLFRSRHIGVDLLPLDGRPPRIIALLNGDEWRDVADAYPAVIHTSPNVQYVRKGGFAPVLRISNHLTARQFRETAFYKEIFSRMGWKDQLGIAVRLKQEALGITFHRDSDFSDEEAEVAGLLHQHLQARFEASCQPVEHSGGQERWDIPLGPALEVLALPVHVSQLFTRYVPPRSLVEGDLPVPIRRWVRTSALAQANDAGAVAHMRISDRHGALLLWFRLGGGRRPALLSVEEKKSRYEFSRLNQLGLTDRQIDIAFWLTQGKTDSEMAALLEISPRTSSKHVESVLARLGCVNRTAAAVHVVEWLSG